MLEFDPSGLQPGEIAFCLRTNQLVSAGRFADFLRAIGETESASRLPRHTLEIVALATGSIFGKIRVRFQHDIGTPDIGHARSELERAANRSPEKAAEILARIDQKIGLLVDEAKAARREGVEAKWTTRAALIIAAAALVNDLSADARSEDTAIPAAVLVADMIEHDGVSDIDLWCDGCQVRIGRNDVPAYAERQDGTVRRPVGRADERNEALPHARPDEIFDPKIPRSIAIQRTGMITIVGDVLLIEQEPNAAAEKPAIVVPPGNYTVLTGQIGTVRGKLYRLLGPQDLIVADTIINAGSGSPE